MTPQEPSLELVAVEEKDRSVLRRLLQLYLHDLSEFIDIDVDPHGEFPYRYLDHYWTEKDRHAFLIRVDGAWAGFALVRACPHLSKSSSARDVRARTERSRDFGEVCWGASGR